MSNRVGKISGGMLKDNLEFYQGGNGRDSQQFRNTNSDDPQLFLDLANQKIGINLPLINTSPTLPTAELEVNNDIKSVNSISEYSRITNNFEIENSSIDVFEGKIFLKSVDTIQLSGLSTDDIFIDNQRISTSNSDANLDLTPNGTGIVESFGDVNVYGDIRATGGISFGGNLVFGDGPETPDKISFGQTINSSIIPDSNSTFNLGSPTRKFRSIYSNLLNGQAVQANDINLGLIDFVMRQGNIFYVSVNGNDSSPGDHPLGPFRTIKRAIEASDASFGGPVTIYILPGEYEEQFPLEIPDNVSIIGEDIRSVTIVPTLETRYNDCFLMNGQTTVENLTIKDFYSGGNFFEVTNSSLGTLTVNVGTGPYAHTYVDGGTVEINSVTYNVTGATYNHTTGEFVITHDGSVTASVGSSVFITSMNFACNGGFREYPDNGYAFRYAPNAVVVNRSPYIQNVTVITKGSVITSDDPRGFLSADAGKGAHIDGARVTPESRNASLLFHAATFITPGVNAITLTNGVRVEWLNSFTYFANIGLYAKNSGEGHLSEDGSTINYGAEIRSIGSASVYGNYGAVADGNDCLMYLINHNFAYIGVGKDVSNDVTFVIEDNQWQEFNNGRVFVQNTDQSGKFKVGDDFFVDFDTGATSIDTSQVALDGLSEITVGSGNDTSVLNVRYIETGNLRFSGNTMFSLSGDINVDSASGEINYTNDVYMKKNLDITGNVTIDGELITFGNQAIDTVTLNIDINQDFIPDINNIYSLGSSTKAWNTVYLDDANIDNVRIFDNVITTTNSNSNLDFLSNSSNYVRTEDLYWNTNTVSTFDTDINITVENKLEIDGEGLGLPKGLNSDFVETTGSIRFTSEDNLFESQGTDSRITFSGVYSDDRLTSVVADPTQKIINFTVNNTKVGEANSQGLSVHGVQSDSILLDESSIETTESNADLWLRRKGTGKISLNGQEYFRDSTWTNTDVGDSSLGALTFATTGQGYVKIESTGGVVLGVGGLNEDNVNDLSVGTDVSGSAIFEEDNAARVDISDNTATGNGLVTSSISETIGNNLTGTYNFFIDLGLTTIDDVKSVEIESIRFRGDFGDTNEYVDLILPDDNNSTYTTRIGEFEDQGDTNQFNTSLVFQALSKNDRTYTNSSSEKSAFANAITLNGGTYGLNASVIIPSTLTTPPSGMTNSWELEINTVIIKTNNKFVKYRTDGDQYYILDEDSSNLSDNDRYLVTDSLPLSTFTAGKITGKMIVGSNSNGSSVYTGSEILFQFSNDGTNDTGMNTIARILNPADAATFYEWKDFSINFEIDSEQIDLSTTKFRIVQKGGGNLGESPVAFSEIRLFTNLDDEVEPTVGHFRYNAVDNYAEVYNGTSWAPATGVVEDPVTDEFMEELVGLYSLVLG